MNLLEAITEEIKRCQELLKQYESMGPPGIFGLTSIKQTIERATDARDSGHPVEMLMSIHELRGCK